MDRRNWWATVHGVSKFRHDWATEHSTAQDILYYNLMDNDRKISSDQIRSVTSRSVVSDSLRPHESQHARPPCPSPSPGVHSDSRPSSWWGHPAISSSVILFSSCPQSFPASGCFPMNQFFASGGQSIGVSASTSVLPMNTQGWFPLGLVWSPCCPRESQESSPTPQFEIINSSALSLLYGPTVTSIHDYWKNNSFDYTSLCRQSDICSFLIHYLDLS